MADLISVARLAGVSRATAARAFSDPHLLKPGTLKKVLAASEQMGFRPNHIARQLRTQHSTTLGVLLPSLLNPVFAMQLQAMEQQARQAGYALLVATSDYQAEREAEIVEHMLHQRVAGLVLTVADADSSALLLTLAAAKMPFVLTHNVPQQHECPALCVDNRKAVAEATAHLISLGHRHIVMAAGPMQQSDRARLRYPGYCEAMQQAGLTPQAMVEMPSHIQSDFKALLPLMNAPSPLTAVICSNDLLAISLLGAVARAGVSVPHQLSVIGFDGIELGEQLSPSLASVVQPIALMSLSEINPFAAGGPVRYRLRPLGALWPWMLLPALLFFAAFWLLPFARLLQIGMTEDRTTHHSGYWTVISQPQYLQSLLNTVLLSAAVTLVTLLIAAVVGCFLARQRFPCDSRSSANPRFLPPIICWFLSPGLCGVPRVTIWAISAARSI